MAGTYPAFAIEWAPGIDPSTAPGPGDWVDATADVVANWNVEWGRWSEFAESGAGAADIDLDNSGGDWDPDNTTGPHYGDLVAGTWFRILGGTTSANTDVFYGHVDDKGFQLQASQFPDSVVTIHLVDDLEQLSHSDLPESVYAIEVEADAPTAWYRLSESSGTQAVDSSGNNLTGTYEGGATFNTRSSLVAGSSNNAIGFDGVDDSVTLPPSAGSDSADFTVEAWISMVEVGADDQIIWEQHHSEGYHTFGVSGTSGTPGTLFFQSASGIFTDVAIGATRVDDGDAHHVVITQASGGAMRVYVDDVQDALDATIGTAVAVNSAAIGYGRADGYSLVGSGRFLGTIDELAIYDGTVLSAGRRTAHYEAGTDPWAGELTSARVTHLLDAVDYDATLRNIDTGNSTVQAASLQGGDAATAVRDIAKTEGGFVYVDHQDGGKLRFVDRRERWTATASLTSQATFGDSGSEITYDAIKLEDDTIVNKANVQRFNGATVTVTDTTSSGARRRPYSESGLLYETDAESQHRAERVVAEKKDRHRVPRTITLRPRKSTHSAWAHVFARKVNDRITVKWRPPYGGTYTFTCWIDGISHKWSSRNGLETTFYLSPVPFDTTGAPYWIWDTSTWETGTSVARWGY